VTVPVPVPSRLTDSAGSVLKAAVTVWFAVSVTVQVAAVPLHPPPVQPAKVEFAPGVAVSVT
jgi:hypothetical protein